MTEIVARSIDRLETRAPPAASSREYVRSLPDSRYIHRASADQRVLADRSDTFLQPGGANQSRPAADRH
jgi:hypothetical protein